MLVTTRHYYLRQLQLCSRRRTPSTTKTLHAHIIKLGLDRSGPSLPNSLVDAYGKCGVLHDALNVFDETPQRDNITWASILASLNQANLSSKALSIFPYMFSHDRLRPDDFVFSTLAKACANTTSLGQGKQVHGNFVVSEYCDDDVVKSSLVDMYAKFGLPDNARAVFDSIRVKSTISWTAMISGYARSGRKKEAIELFRELPIRNLYSWTALISGFVQGGLGFDALCLFVEMRREGVDIVDPLVLSSVIGHCANFTAMVLGKQLHGLVISLGFESCVFIGNAFIDMYAKCSDITAAKDVFEKILYKDVVSWTSMIVGVAQHGQAEKALAFYDDMTSNRVKPNEVTFIGLIYACSHVGNVSRGRELFKSMVEEYRIRPSLQHYTCLLDLLGRSGLLEEAENVIRAMPYQPDETTWVALLSACKHHENKKMAVRVADHLLSNLKPEDASTYILLSNVYSGACLWGKASEARRKLMRMDVRKGPGFSRVEIGKESQVFYAGEMFHPLKDEITALLREFEAEMRKRGYVPDTSSVLHDMEQQEKERQLFWHSERSAVAYGLLKAVPGMVIRVIKNLRVCGDCHVVLKHISDISKRELVVRDATRYHHFKDGVCSCNDFW